MLLRSNESRRSARRGDRQGETVENLTEVQAPLLAKPHDVSFGYFEDFTKIPGLYDEVSPRRTGSDIIREGITWTVLQPTEGTAPSKWRWGQFDEFYEAALAAGLRPIFTFRTPPAGSGEPVRRERAQPARPRPLRRVRLRGRADRGPLSPDLCDRALLRANNENMWGRPPDPRAFSTAVGLAADSDSHRPGNTIKVYAGGLAPGEASPDKYFFGRFISDALSTRRDPTRRRDRLPRGHRGAVQARAGSDRELTSGGSGSRPSGCDRRSGSTGLSMPIAFTQLSYSTGDATYPYHRGPAGRGADRPATS